jgi:hypothetical protein
MRIMDFDPAHRGAAQGDLYLFRLTDAEAKKLTGAIAKAPQHGSIRLLEGEVTGHHHEIVLDREDGDAADPEASAEVIAVAALAIAKARSAASRGTATLYRDDDLARRLPWLRRQDLIIGFLVVSGGPVVLRHPEHDAIKLPSGTYYVGRQVESAGAEERVVAD